MRLTPKEKLIMQAILDSEYGDNPTDDVWTTYLAENAGLNKRSMGGIVNSLVKKGLARTGVCEGMGSGFGDMDTLGLTPEGVEAAVAAGLTSPKTDGIVYVVSRFSADRPYRVGVDYRSWVEGKDEYQVFETLSEARARETELNGKEN